MHAIFIVLAALLLLILAVGAYTFFAACRRKKERKWLDPEALKGSSVEKHYPYILHAHNWLCSHKVEAVQGFLV